MLDQLKSLGVLATVVEEQSFRGAGAKLGLSPSVISHHISKLEKELGAALILRSTRSLTLTNEGEALYRSASSMMKQAKAGIGALVDRAESAVIDFRIAIPGLLASHPIFNRVVAFAKEQRGTHLQLMTSDRTVDLLKGRFDIAIRMGRLKDSELKTRKLGEDERLAVASPDYVASKPELKSPEDLTEWDFIRFTPVPRGYSFTQAGKRKVTVQESYSVTTDSIYAAKHLALSGMGVAGIPASFVQRELADGSLVYLLPEWQGQALGIYAVWAENVGLNPVHQRFMSYITGRKREKTG